ncbi:uncharacterized protein LOC125673006 isoform X2 [Ostrea edulis]|uniref:uncharacterized protein LOC125673006 isoform X2 n=1 Tax=Ostrea edulis TaxID=37623 RepID=UPI0024AEB6D8|nr:uncharacterized protein LOC125673006 isoform X2 [Ostrea edulis]
MEVDSEEYTYKFEDKRRYQGLALVIANFTKGPHKRNGAEQDLKYMKKTFKRLGFKVFYEENVTTPEFLSLLNHYSKSDTLKNYDCFAFAISSHGLEREERKGGSLVHHHVIQMFDDEFIDTSQILDYFSPKKCKIMKGKPKLFFLQACRIPESKASKDHLDAGIGFDHGSRTHPHHGGRELEKEVSEGDVSDTDVEDDPDLVIEKPPSSTTLGGQDTGDTLEVLDQRQTEIITNLKRLQNQTWQLGRVYTATGTNQIKESNYQANQIKESKYQATEGEDEQKIPLQESKKTANESGRMEGVGLHLPTESRGSGDELDPPRGVRLDQRAALNITVVPCHNDMLIMFASPQGLYAIRSKDHGSYMLKILYESVERYYGHGKLRNNKTNFLEVLRDVTAKMSAKTFFGSKEYTIVPCIVHQLSKDIVFRQGQMMVDSKFSLKLPSSLASIIR